MWLLAPWGPGRRSCGAQPFTPKQFLFCKMSMAVAPCRESSRGPVLRSGFWQLQESLGSCLHRISSRPSDCFFGSCSFPVVVWV